MKIYLATGNKNKKREMSEIFSEHNIVIPSDEGITFDPIEDGTTFYENSLIKARSLWEIVHAPVIADDSGICVDILKGIPGIYSARYAGPSFPQGRPDGKKVPQEEQNLSLIEQTNKAIAEHKTPTNFLHGPRSCHYTCSMVLFLSPDRLFIAQETMEGTLVNNISEAHGSGGFGYDPIFYLPEYEKTAADLTAEQKNEISHRGKACRAIQKIINGLNF